MSEMVERVAKAIRSMTVRPEGIDHRVRWSDADEIARVAIEAMRVPTKAMVDAAYDPCEFGSDYHAEGIYTAMIDAAQDKPA